MDCVVGNVAANAARIDRFAREAAAEGCEALFLPELSDTGYDGDAAREHADEWPGTGYDAVRNAATTHGLAVICGVAEHVGGTLHNGLAAIDSSGERIAKYRKLFLFDGAGAWEPETFTPGEEAVVCDLAGQRWGLSICYDLRFPEQYRALTALGATALVNCSAWPNVRWEHWDLLTRARAVENQAFFIGVNRCGTDIPTNGDGLTFAGRSRVVAPTGELLAEAGPTGEALVVADLDFNTVASFRTLLPALAARRPTLFTDSPPPS
ncbi:Omega-amidase YafV [Planctomycetes bacterium LzC2]|uniref:Omega-amidase YafV n=2 Tax=Alienimonas chondri TaxID=2681879 RepID=A0ABX1VEU4_9PLAN|nr:Omega-amidase YafV [Alienimonas chondri]